MLEFRWIVEGKLLEAINVHNVIAHIYKGKIDYISTKITSSELRQIADKLDELNGK